MFVEVTGQYSKTELLWWHTLSLVNLPPAPACRNITCHWLTMDIDLICQHQMIECSSNCIDQGQNRLTVMWAVRYSIMCCQHIDVSKSQNLLRNTKVLTSAGKWIRQSQLTSWGAAKNSKEISVTCYKPDAWSSVLSVLRTTDASTVCNGGRRKKGAFCVCCIPGFIETCLFPIVSEFKTLPQQIRSVTSHFLFNTTMQAGRTPNATGWDAITLKVEHTWSTPHSDGHFVKAWERICIFLVDVRSINLPSFLTTLHTNSWRCLQTPQTRYQQTHLFISVAKVAYNLSMSSGRQCCCPKGKSQMTASTDSAAKGNSAKK